MIQINGKLRKWGNSLGVIVPLSSVKSEGLKEGEEVKVLIGREQKRNILRESFGTYKSKKSIEQIMKEMDEELYDN